MPKLNMYQSLHTTVLGENGEPFEIQIRTYEMHRVAEYGIAAHWKYKEGKADGSQNSEELKLAWLRQTLEWQQELNDPKEFMETLKMDLFSSQVFVFTPKGESRGDREVLEHRLVHGDVGVGRAELHRVIRARGVGVEGGEVGAQRVRDLHGHSLRNE